MNGRLKALMPLPLPTRKVGLKASRGGCADRPTIPETTEQLGAQLGVPATRGKSCDVSIFEVVLLISELSGIGL